MRAEFKLKNADNLEATISITATVGDLRILLKQLEGDGWPASDLRYTLREVITAATEHFASEAKHD